MNILFANGHLHVGGCEKSLVNILRSIDYQKHSVDLLLVEDLGEYKDEIPDKVRIIYFDLKRTEGSVRDVLKKAVREKDPRLALLKIAITAANKLDKRFLRYMWLPKELKKKYDCAIAYRVGMPLDLVSFAVNAEVKCALWHHGEFDYPDSETQKWNNAFRNIDHIVCVSEYTKKMISPHFPKYKEKMCVLPNMILPDEIRRDAEAFDPYKGVEQKRILVSVGRMSAEKHMGDTVDVMRKLKERGVENVIWYLVGDGAERRNIEEKIRAYGLQSYFCLVGSQPNPYPYIKHADIFVHPSRVESQGIGVLEAMTLEKPCVIVRSKGTEEFVKDRYNALQAEQSIDDLTEKVVELLADNRIKFPGQAETVRKFLPGAILPSFYKLISHG